MKPKPSEQVQLVSLATGQTQPAEVESFEGKRLGLRTGDPPPLGLIRIEGGGWLALGEVAAIEQGSPVQVVIDVEHLVLNTDELARRREAWRG